MASDWAEECARDIVEALQARRGFTQAFDVDEDVFEEMLEEIADIIEEMLDEIADIIDESAP
jgi:hypothetical protein